MKKRMRYIFESNYMEKNLRIIEVEVTDNIYCFYVDEVFEIINTVNKTLIRKTDDFEMIFDFENSIGKIILLENQVEIDLELYDTVFDVEDCIMISFKYELDEVNEISLCLEDEK